MTKGRTESGYEYEYDERIMNDWRFAKALVGTKSKDKGEQLVSIMKIGDLLLGEDGMERLTQHIQEQNDGFAPLNVVDTTIAEIMRAAKNTKN